ncbi:MAG: efflux RND transporter permease subunit [Candidatus Omnitrophota bacterium]|nr:efflux RND transporter permease subunit [Candidatus Omnitrophota bacterium]
MSLPEFAIRKKVTIVMATLGLILLGMIYFSRLPQELFPPIVFPQVTIITEYTNAAPEEIETLITKPIEEAIGSVSGLKRIESISREGRSAVIVSFDWGQDIDFAALAAREKIDLVKERLPKESEDPIVLKFDPLARPVLILSVTGKDLEPIRLKFLAEKVFKDNLEKLEGVASVSISGGADREVLVEIDQGRLHANHLSLLEIIEAIENANVTYPAGSIKKGLYEYLIRTVGEFRSVREIGYAVAGVDIVEEMRREDTSFVERGETGPRETLDTMREEVERSIAEKRLVLVRDIAEVIDSTAERTSISRYNGSENISIAVQKQASANTIQVVDALKKALEFLDMDIKTRGMDYSIIYDHSKFIRNSLKNLLSESLMGGFLAFIVLLFFLRAAGPSLLVTLSIPVTVIGVFFLMGMTGITLNIMSLGGLALGVGMIVDTSIVVLENIFRRRQLGEDAEEGAIRGSEEVIWPVFASNLTTISVFFPLIVFVPGIPGQLFKDLSWTVIYSQVLAALVPLTLITMLSVYLKVKQGGYEPMPWTRFFEERLVGDQDPAKKTRLLLWVLALAFGMCSIALVIMPMLDQEVLPKVDQGQFIVKIDMRIGTRLEVTDRVIRRIEEALAQVPEVRDVAVTIGSEKSRRGQVQVESLRPSQALIMVALDPDRKRTSAQVVDDVREKMRGVGTEGARVEFILQESEFAFAEGGTKPILVEVKGYDFMEMKQLVDGIKGKLGKIPGIVEIQDDMGETSPETKLNIDKKRAALYGISALDVSLIAKAAIEGVVATQYREGGKEYDVRVRLSERDRRNIHTLNDLLLYSQVLDALIPLKEVAEIVQGEGPSEIRRANQERTIVISADIVKDMKSKDVLTKVQDLLATLEISSDFQVVLSGKAREVKENFSKVIFAFVLSIILVYMIMASQFESFIQPLIIMFTVPLAFFGVSVALWITGTSMNVISMLGIVILGGIVVNNGIVLIEYINQLREQGLDVEEAALTAAKVRTRPILMSALTTIFGLVPLALGLGEGSELRAPMAITVMGGLLSSTFLTLIVIPFLYIFVTRLTQRFFVSAESDAEEDEQPI